MKQLITTCFILLAFLCKCAHADVDINIDTTVVRNGLSIIKVHTDWAWEEGISPKIEAFEQVGFEDLNSTEQVDYIFNRLKMHKWGQQISEALGLFDILFSYKEESYQKEFRSPNTEILLNL